MGISMTKKNKKLVAWRLSKEARELVSEVAKQTGLTKTEVVQICILKHARGIPALADSANKLLGKLFAKEVSDNDKED